jgi:predicted Zn-dependent peptidase
VSAARLRAYHAARLGPGGAYLVLVGDLEESAARDALESALAAWAARPAPPPPPALPDHGRARAVLVERPGSAQASLIVAQTSALTPLDPDYLSFIAMNHVLGGTANSRMFENLRTRRGYTYGAYSSLEVYGRGIVWSAGADVRPDVAKDALEEIRFEVRRLRGEPIPEEVLASSKRHLGGLFLMRLASLDRVAGYLAAVVESGRDPVVAMATYQERLGAVTPAAALEAARTRLEPERFVSIVVGDPKVLKPILGL